MDHRIGAVRRDVSRWGAFALGCLMLAGCAADDDDGVGGDGGIDAAVDGGAAHDSGAPPDAGGEDGGGVDAGEDAGTEACDDGLARWPFDPSASAVAYDSPVPDISLSTTDGPFSLAVAWTGCDNYVFVLYQPGYGADADLFWESDVAELIGDSAKNTHYLFVTLENADEAARETRVRAIETRVDAYLQAQGAAAKERWAGRFHYVLDRGDDIPVVSGVLAANPNEVHFTIDRHQLLREGHNTAYYSGVWQMELRNTRYWSRYYNAQYALDEKLAAEQASGAVLVQRVADHEDIRATEPFTWTLPDAAAIAGFGRLAADLRVECPGAGHPYAATCGEWDTVGGIWLCGDEACTSNEQRRIIKWITPYSAPGRWLIDITPELVALAAGGELRFVAAHGDNDVGPYTYKYTVDLRFGVAADGLEPFAVETLVAEGGYDFATMDAAFEPFEVTPPAGAKKVELYARISGHGSDPVAGCAEFCTFEHTFDVNGALYSHSYLMEYVDRCAAMVEQGVTPNQGGTWHFDRSSWCPGWVTEEWREDLTPSFDLGGPNTIEHLPTQQGGPPPGGTMDARVELVYYR